MTNLIQKLEPPALPLPTTEYSPAFHNQKDNVFRLFFNRLTSLLGSVLSTSNGGRFLYFPHAQFYCSAGQTLESPNTAYPVGYNTIEFSNGITLVDNTKITFSISGIYKVDGTLQLKNSSGTAAVVFVWLELNAAKIDYSAHEYQMQGVVSSQLAKSTSIVEVQGGDELRLMWAANTTDVFLLKDDPTALHPGVPCAEVAVHFVSNV